MIVEESVDCIRSPESKTISRHLSLQLKYVLRCFTHGGGFFFGFLISCSNIMTYCTKLVPMGQELLQICLVSVFLKRVFNYVLFLEKL